MMADKIEIVNSRGTPAHVDPDVLDIWLADKKEGWTVVKPKKVAKKEEAE